MFLAFKTFSQSFFWQNLTITGSLSFLLTSIQIFFIDIAVKILKYLTHLRLALPFDKDLGNPTISRVFLLEYWSFSQHCLPVSNRQDDNSKFAYLCISCLLQFFHICRLGVSIPPKLKHSEIPFYFEGSKQCQLVHPCQVFSKLPPNM